MLGCRAVNTSDGSPQTTNASMVSGCPPTPSTVTRVTLSPMFIWRLAPLGSVTASEILRQAWPRQAGWLPAANRQSHRPAQGKGPEAHLFHVIELSNTMTRLSLLTDPVTAAKPSGR